MMVLLFLQTLKPPRVGIFDDILEPAIEIDAQGFIHLPTGAGTGFQVNRNKIERYTIASEEFKS